MPNLKTVAIYTEEDDPDAADVTIATFPSTAVATKAALMRDYAEATLLKTRGLVSVTLANGTNEDLVLDIQGRMTDADTFATVLAAPLTEADTGKIIEVE